MFVAQPLSGLPIDATQPRAVAADLRARTAERVRPVPQDGERFDLRDSRRSAKLARPRVETEDRPQRTDPQPGERARLPVLSDGDSPLVARGGAAFLAQLLGQTDGEPPTVPAPSHDRGTTAYRKAGGEPHLYPEAPAVFRLSA